MYSFPNLEPAYSMSVSNCCFLTCIQSSQQTGKVVWYSQLFNNFPQSVVIHRVNGFSIINEAEVAVWNSLAFSVIQWMLAVWSLVLLPLLTLACTSGSPQFAYCWSLAWRIFSITLLACEMSKIVWYFCINFKNLKYVLILSSSWNIPLSINLIYPSAYFTLPFGYLKNPSELLSAKT